MPIYRLTNDAITALPKTSYADRGVKERADLQRLLKSNIAVVAPDVLVLCEEFGDWDDSKRRIDLLGIDRNACLVVIELKRDQGRGPYGVAGHPIRGDGLSDNVSPRGQDVPVSPRQERWRRWTSRDREVAPNERTAQ